jgi:hypothetical protein
MRGLALLLIVLVGSCAPVQAPRTSVRWYHIPSEAREGDRICDRTECMSVKQFRLLLHSVSAD